MTAEQLSIIAVCISGIATIFAASSPAIFNFIIKKKELDLQEKRDFDANFEEYYQRHVKVLKDFSNYYAEWTESPNNNIEIITFLKDIAPEFRLSVSSWFYKLIEKIANYKEGDNLDDDYKLCRILILQSYGVRISADTPGYFLSDMLRVTLRKQFKKLQRAKIKEFRFHKG